MVTATLLYSSLYYPLYFTSSLHPFISVGHPCFVSKLVTLTTSDMSDVDLLLFEAGCLTDMTWSVVGDAVAPTHRIIIVAITYDVAHAAGHTHAHTHHLTYYSLVIISACTVTSAFQ